MRSPMALPSPAKMVVVGGWRFATEGRREGEGGREGGSGKVAMCVCVWGGDVAVPPPRPCVRQYDADHAVSERA